MPYDSDVPIWRGFMGCSAVLQVVVEHEVASISRVGAAQRNRNGHIHHHFASAQAGADNTLIFHVARDVTMCADCL
jgi:hypothetical protein